jgi:hypothetical protein
VEGKEKSVSFMDDLNPDATRSIPLNKNTERVKNGHQKEYDPFSESFNVRFLGRKIKSRIDM